jgi:Fe2+ transport system protein FeoA
VSASVPLNRLPLGGEGFIAFVPAGSLQLRLASLGLVPGALVELRQTAPVVVVESGGTTLALEPSVAAEILVRSIAGTSLEASSNEGVLPWNPHRSS